MKDGPDIARLGSLIGDPARSNMLTALMAGKALTASELAREAGVTQQTASSHLRRLEDGGLIIPRKQGRNKYFALAGESVAHALEALMGLAIGVGHVRTRTGPRDEQLREARVCYNHLAGQLATRLFDHMLGSGHLEHRDDALTLTNRGESFADSLGIDTLLLQKRRSPLCLECLDWSERRSHLAGSLGRAIFSRFEELGWARRDVNLRIVIFTQEGRRKFERLVAAPG
jgi:DNA-binding transcriptional ArsR family regulator